MGAFVTLAAAETRARVLMDDGRSATYGIVEAYACKNISGTIGVRVLRLANVTAGAAAESGMSKPGGWDFLDDDAAT